jgi:photosystem II stability/assembly factor-like uncharacterized protein
MAGSALMIATEKGLFLLDRDAAAGEWDLRGPFCESWPIGHAVQDPETGTMYAAGASAWHGAGVWRSTDRGATWELSSEGLAYSAESGRKLTKIMALTVAPGRVIAGTDSAGLFESRDGGVTWSLFSEIKGVPGRDVWDLPDHKGPGELGVVAIVMHPDDPDRFIAVVQANGAFETRDNGATWAPRNHGLRADWPLDDPEVGYCVHKLVRSPVDSDRLFQQNHCGVHRSDDGGQSWTDISKGLPTDFGFAAATHPHDKDTMWVIPLDPGHGRTMPEGRAAVWRTRDAGSTWQQLGDGLPQEGAYLGVLRTGLTIDSEETPNLYFGTSNGHVFASEDAGESWAEIASYLPRISSVEVATLS